MNEYFAKKKSIFGILLISTLLSLCFISCTENRSNGDRVGFVTQFSESGIVFKSYEGHLNMSQTGTNSSQAFDFSIDNDKPDQNVIDSIKLALDSGYKVKLTYHKVFNKNWFRNRGNTDYFITHCQILR